MKMPRADWYLQKTKLTAENMCLFSSVFGDVNTLDWYRKLLESNGCSAVDGLGVANCIRQFLCLSIYGLGLGECYRQTLSYSENRNKIFGSTIQHMHIHVFHALDGRRHCHARRATTLRPYS